MRPADARSYSNDTSSPCEQSAARGGFFGCMTLGSRFEGKLSFGLLGLFGLGLPRLLGEPRKRIPGTVQTVQSDACGKCMLSTSLKSSVRPMSANYNQSLKVTNEV